MGFDDFLQDNGLTGDFLLIIVKISSSLARNAIVNTYLGSLHLAFETTAKC